MNFYNKMDDSSGDEIEFCQNVEPHEDDSTIKSKAVVKFSSVQAPAKFTRLQSKTDLNLPPSNWLCNSANNYGIPQSLHSSVGFASFNMAHMFSDCLEDVDVVSDAENIKKLLKLPYSPQSAISMMVHNIGNTLLIDEFDIQKYLLRKADDDDWNWLRTFIHENILNRLSDKNRSVCLKDKSREAINRKNLLSKFLYYTLQQSTVDPTVEEDKIGLKECRPLLPLLGPILPEPNIGENVPDPNSSHVFNRNIVWTFEDIRMLIGTDMPIFGGGTRPCISLKLRDMKQPINVLTGIDYWLDNLMCNVPEVVMCYHLDGIVQKYELIKTEDLPYLEDSTFSPQVIRNVAQNILAFLKSNATKAGHTYWLFKGKNDDVVKLYDLTTLCKNNDEESNNETASPASTNATNTKDPKNENPFTVPVAMLLYTVARNIKNTSEQMSSKKAGSIKALLENCIKLLPKEKYPQIVTSSHYIISDLHIPAGIDPKSPRFSDNSDIDSDSQSFYEDDYNFQDDDENGASDDLDLENDYSGNSSNEFRLIDDRLNENIAVKSICDTLKEFSQIEKNLVKRNNRPPSPLQGSIEERCKVCLQHVDEGLSCLQYFNVNEEQITAEMAERKKEEEKRKIIHEEQHPLMAKPFQPIPLPYESLNQNLYSGNINDEPMKMNNRDKPIPMKWIGFENDDSGIDLTIKGKNKKSKSKKSKGNMQKKINTDDYDDQKRLIPTIQKNKKIYGSWNIHLKLLLIEKACLTFVTLAEHNYVLENYGICLRSIYLAFGCQGIVTKFMATVSPQKSILLVRAGDCLFQIVKNYNNIDEYLEQYEKFDYSCAHILEEFDKELEEEFTRNTFQPMKNVPELMLASSECYELALDSTRDDRLRSEIIRKLGSVRNELGLKYMYCAQEEYNKFVQSEQSTSDVLDKSSITKEEVDKSSKLLSKEPRYQTLAKQSYDSLIRGVAAFEEVHDNVNLAFLLCNMGRFMRFRAHIHLNGENPDDVRLQKRFYNQSFSYYQRALGILQNRKLNPELWDLVNWELSTATFTLAKQVQDFSNKLETSTEEVEKEIIELLQKSLKLCDVEHPGSRQILYMYRSGLIHNRLASFYHSQYRKFTSMSADCLDELQPTLKTNLQLCRLHYDKSAKILENLKEVKDYLVVQLERIALQEFLAEVAKNNQKMKSLQTGLEICFQTKIILIYICSNKNLENIPIDEIGKLLKLFESRLQFLLKTLTKLSMVQKGGGNGKESNKMGNIYKLMFSASLNIKSIENEIELAEHLVNVLDKIIKIKNSN